MLFTFTLVFVVSWYVFSSEGKEELLISSIVRFFSDPLAVHPHTGAYSMQLESPFSIQILKGLYFLLTGLIASVLEEGIRRIQDNSRIVDNKYLLVGIACLGILAATFLPGGVNFGEAYCGVQRRL